MLLRRDKAAQYVRMSTDMQCYSIENQKDAIELYAARHGLTVVRSYEDSARSGVHIDGRTALQTLIDDVCSGRADFSTILVYDVSRWGRFQDCDESAHYEFLCRRSGVNVEYCAEQFENDGSLTTAVLKNIKRAMAGEFSRELSVKVFAAKRLLVTKGYWMGASPGYGLRRMLVDASGNQKFELKPGERKSLHSERVILVPGPLKEIETIGRVYDEFIEQRKSLGDIASLLNAEGSRSGLGRKWTSATVRELLSNEKYLGNSVYNRTSRKLSVNWQRNPKSEWVRNDGAFEPIVSLQLFQAANKRLQDLKRRISKNELLDALSALWCSRGRLNAKLVDAAKGFPGTAVYSRAFGSLAAAYDAIGYPQFKPSLARNSELRKIITAALITEVTRRGGEVKFRSHKKLVINNEFKVNIYVSRVRGKPPLVWQFGYRSKEKPDIVVGVRLAKRNGPIVDYFILPFIYLPHGTWITTSATSGLRLDRFRCETLEPFYNLCARTRIEASKW